MHSIMDVKMFMPPVKSRVMKGLLQEACSQRPPKLGVTIHQNVTLKPLGQIPGLDDTAGPTRLIEHFDWVTDIVPAESPVEEATVAYCGYIYPSSWGHFLLNSLSRVWIAVDEPESIDRYVFYCDKPDVVFPPNFNELFELLGIADKVEVITGKRSYSKVIVADPAFLTDTYIAPEYVTMIREICARVDGADLTSESAPIFLTRSEMSSAGNTDFGIDLIDHLFLEAGFEIVAPERLSLRQLIRKFRSAPIVAMMSGSCSHNAVFVPPTTPVHIVERTAVCNLFQPLVESAFANPIVHVEASYTPQPVAYGGGPFLYALTPWLCEYAKWLGLTIQPKSYRPRTADLLRWLFRRFRLYRFKGWIEEWALSQRDVQRESATFLRMLNPGK